MALEEASTFNLEEVINNTKNDQLIFENLGHFVMSDLLHNHFHTKDFDFFNAFDWIVILAVVCGILTLILVGIVQYKVRTLFTLLAATRSAQAQEFSKHLTFKTTTTMPETVT